MATSDFDKFNEAMRDSKNSISEMLKAQKELEKGMGAYVKAYKDIRDLTKEITEQNKNLKELENLRDKENKKEAKELLELEKKAEKLGDKILKKDLDRLNVLLLQKKARNEAVNNLEKEIRLLERGLDNTKKAVKESNKLKAIARTTGSFVKKWGFDKLKTLGVFDMDREIRNAARSIGVGAKQSKAFSLNLQKAGENTVYMGVNTKKLAEMQQGYSEELGRAVVLSQDGLEALADIGAGTGVDGLGVKISGAMDKLGASVKTTRDLVQETVDYARDIGVNAAKAAEMTTSSLKLAQRFRFKGGAKGLAKMATEALKLRIDMDAMAGVADKVFRPEGAIQLAAELQTMGGAFAKMADPMQLMFKARNDMAGFSKDIAKASSEFVTFNKETGEFEVKGGAALDRMREIGNMTGLGAEKLQEMAVAQKRIETIGSVSPVSFSDEDDELISGLATIQKGGEIEIQVGEFTKNVKDLTQRDMKFLRAEKETLRQRAEEARTAEDTLLDIKTSFVQLLVPVAQALKEDFATPLKNLVNNKEFKDTIRSLVSGIANLVGGITKFVIENPITSLVTAVAGIGLFSAVKWYAQGISLGLGFNTVASSMGPGTLLGGVSKIGTTLFGGGLKSVGAIGTGVVAGGIAGYNEYRENKEMGMSGGENATRTIAKGAGAGLGGWGGAAAGAALGTAILPGIGTLVGGLIGGAIGAFGGGALGEAVGDGIYGDERRGSTSMRKPRAKSMSVQDGIVKLGTKVTFDDRDNFLLASTSKNQLNKSAETLVKNNGGGYGGSSVMTHKFEKMNISVTVNGVGVSDEMAKAIINSDAIIEGINEGISKKVSSNVNGGIENARNVYTG